MKTASNYFISYVDVLNSLSGNLPTQDLKGTGFEFPWVGSSQKSCKNSEPRPDADAALKGIHIFYIKHPWQESSLCLMAAFSLQAIAGTFHRCREGCFTGKGGFLYAEALMRTSFAGRTEYSGKLVSNTPWSWEGCTQQGSGFTTGYQCHNLLSLQCRVIAFGSRASWSVWTSSQEYFSCLFYTLLEQEKLRTAWTDPETNTAKTVTFKGPNLQY